VSQTAPGQQASPAPPQLAQVPPLQTVDASVQMVPSQQGSPAAPQVPQLPESHAPPVGQSLPAPTQLPS
jgi:hypothetical protein